MKVVQVTLVSGEVVRGDTAKVTEEGTFVIRSGGSHVVQIVDPIETIEEIDVPDDDARRARIAARERAAEEMDAAAEHHCRRCHRGVEHIPGVGWVDVVSGDDGGTYDICPEAGRLSNGEEDWEQQHEVAHPR